MPRGTTTPIKLLHNHMGNGKIHDNNSDQKFKECTKKCVPDKHIGDGE